MAWPSRTHWPTGECSIFLFDFDAMRDALNNAVRAGADPGSPAEFAGNIPTWLFAALHANRALTLAEHIVSFER